jgi:uncharacterized coiled-coil DUF342 family protein
MGLSNELISRLSELKQRHEELNLRLSELRAKNQLIKQRQEELLNKFHTNISFI